MNVVIKNPKSVTVEGNKVVAVELSKKQLKDALRKIEEAEDPNADLYEPAKVKELLSIRTKLKDPAYRAKNLVSLEQLQKSMGM